MILTRLGALRISVDGEKLFQRRMLFGYQKLAILLYTGMLQQTVRRRAAVGICRCLSVVS